MVTICRNARATIERTVGSVLSQEGPTFEYLVIDGGSTDGTLELLRPWADRLAHLVSEPDGGISDAFNKGLQRCRGEWVGTVNADDWYEPGALARIAALPEDVEIACGSMRYWAGERAVSVFGADPRRLRREMTINHQATFVRRRVYERLGLFRPDFKYAMDYELFLRFSVGGARFAAFDGVLANMRYEGISHRRWVRAYGEVRRAKRLHGQGALGAWGAWAVHLLRGGLRLFLEGLGLGALVALYRRRFSVVRKRA
ncbi:MAG: glycosyltransferase [Spirochaetes bacterium]|nr:glycosyltransferase [Spirochaetota bacterium]